METSLEYTTDKFMVTRSTTYTWKKTDVANKLFMTPSPSERKPVTTKDDVIEDTREDCEILGTNHKKEDGCLLHKKKFHPGPRRLFRGNVSNDDDAGGTDSDLAAPTLGCPLSSSSRRRRTAAIDLALELALPDLSSSTDTPNTIPPQKKTKIKRSFAWREDDDVDDGTQQEESIPESCDEDKVYRHYYRYSSSSCPSIGDAMERQEPIQSYVGNNQQSLSWDDAVEFPALLSYEEPEGPGEKAIELTPKCELWHTIV